MRILALVVLLLALPSVGAPASVSQRPTLRVVSMTPLAVQGKTFKPNESVQLLVNAGKPLRAFVRAGTLGGFRFVFRHWVPVCTAVSVQAVGNRGSRASFSLDQPDCAPIPG